MPGTNIWRLPGITAGEGSGTKEKIDEAKDLRENGYKIFGWDHEFEMNFEIADLQRAAYEKGLDGNFDLYHAVHIDLDRPTDTGQAVFDRVESEFDEYWPDTQKENRVLRGICG